MRLSSKKFTVKGSEDLLLSIPIYYSIKKISEISNYIWS